MKRKVDDALLARARRMATRTRAEAACLPCKFKKAKCNDYRPCKRCLDSGSDLCVDGSSAARSNTPECLESGQDLSKDGSSAAKRGVAPAFTAGEAVSSHSSLPPAGYAMDVFRNSAGRDFRSEATSWNTQPAQLSPLVSWMSCTTLYSSLYKPLLGFGSSVSCLDLLLHCTATHNLAHDTKLDAAAAAAAV